MSAPISLPGLLLLTPIPSGMRESLRPYFELHDEKRLDATGRMALSGRVRALLCNAQSTVSEAQMRQWPRLEMIAVIGVGMDGIDLDAAAALGIVVRNTPEVSTEDIADHTLALLLSVTRQILRAHQFVKNGQWKQGRHPPTSRFGGRRLGIVGLGRIGSAVARRALAFDMSIAYTGRAPKSDVPYRWYDTPAELAANVDFLVVCASGGSATRGLIDAAVLQALGPKVTLVNIGRGSIVDEAALIQALQTGVIAGAALDVFADEPNVPQALLELPNVVLTPHMASATAEGFCAMLEQTQSQLVEHFSHAHGVSLSKSPST